MSVRLRGKASPEVQDPLVRGAREHYDDAVYYDHAYRRRTGDVDYYRRVVRESGGPVLEIGGGSGRVALPLVQDGHTVTVLDAHAGMLARAREKADTALDGTARARLTLVEADMRSFDLGCTFPTVLAPFNVVQHLYEPDDFARCFGAVARHLAPDGRFVFDARVPQPVELARNPERVYRDRGFVHPTLGRRVVYEEQFDYDPVKQVQYVTLRFRPGLGAPRGTPTVETLLAHRQIFPNELRALLALGGLRLAGRHGDFDGRPLRRGDAQQIITAVRA